MTTSVEDDLLFDSLTSGNAHWVLRTYQGERLMFTNIFPSRKAMYLLSINCCTFALKALQYSVDCPLDLAWYPYCIYGLYLDEKGCRTGFRGLGSTNELWIWGCRSWLYDIWIGSIWAFLCNDVYFDTLGLGSLIWMRRDPRLLGWFSRHCRLPYKDSVALEMVIVEKTEDHKVLLVHYENTRHLQWLH